MASPFPPLDQPLWDEVGAPLNRRHDPRLPVGSVLPVQLRALPEAAPPGAWLSADILDISHGGLALLVQANAALSSGCPLLLDVSNHPGFAAVRLPATLRWSAPADGLGALQVIGVQLDRPLPRVPPLVQSRK